MIFVFIILQVKERHGNLQIIVTKTKYRKHSAPAAKSVFILMSVMDNTMAMTCLDHYVGH